MAVKTVCEGCGKKAAGGGHRYCYACIGALLSNTAARYEQPVKYTPKSK